jgi:biopolymer transport protein ExbD
MAIRFRCRHCQTLMSIATRRAGSIVPCATCGEGVLVPHQDEWSSAVAEPLVNPESIPERPVQEPVEEFAGFTVAEDEFVPPDPPLPPPEARDEEPLEDTDDDEGFRLSRDRPVEEELDLTAMVDVVFQLLIFFMVTASFSLTKSIEMPTPDQDKQGAAQAMQPLEDMQDTSVIVEIDDRDAVLVDDEPLANIEKLADALRDRMRKEQKSELVVTAAANATHRTVVAVIDAANEVGMQRIRMTAPSRANVE